jgi:hypothetical protein
MESQLVTTNQFLGIIAAMSVVEMLLVVGACIAMFVIYMRMQRAYLNVMDLVSMAEQRHVVPTLSRVNAILDDVKDVTAIVKEETDRLDTAINSTIDRVDQTATRVRSNVLAKTSSLMGLVRGARVVIEAILKTRAA